MFVLFCLDAILKIEVFKALFYQRMFSEKYSILAYGETLMSLIEDRCSIVEIPYDVATYDVSLGLPNHSPYADIFNYFIKKNIENGNLDRIKTKWSKTAKGGCRRSQNVDSMGFDNVVSAFIMLILGITITIFVFGGEICMGWGWNNI